MVMVDDATNRTYARFIEEEMTRAAYEIFERYVRRFGLPQALYVDRDSIYETSREPSVEELDGGDADYLGRTRGHGRERWWVKMASDATEHEPDFLLTGI